MPLILYLFASPGWHSNINCCSFLKFFVDLCRYSARKISIQLVGGLTSSNFRIRWPKYPRNYLKVSKLYLMRKTIHMICISYVTHIINICVHIYIYGFRTKHPFLVMKLRSPTFSRHHGLCPHCWPWAVS